MWVYKQVVGLFDVEIFVKQDVTKLTYTTAALGAFGVKKQIIHEKSYLFRGKIRRKLLFLGYYIINIKFLQPKLPPDNKNCPFLPSKPTKSAKKQFFFTPKIII